MAPNNGLANAKNKNDKDVGVGTNTNKSTSNTSVTKRSGTTTILEAGTVEARGMGTNINSHQVISDQIQNFLRGEGRCSPRAELRGFFTVWTFVTRLPGPTWVDHHPGYLMRGMAYFPFSGALIGAFVCVFHDLAHFTLGLPLIIASVISEAASLWVTGCFHEDGLADSADGIGGGWTSEQILKIMTDTRLGTYGCAILLLYIIAKLELLTILGASSWVWGACEGGGPAIIVTHTLARLTAPLLIKTRDYVDEQGPKYRFYSFFVEAKHLVTWYRVLFAIVTSLLVAHLAYGLAQAIVLVTSVLVAAISSGKYAEYLLGGVMGDYLGATICVTEVYLLTILALLRSDELPNLISFVGELYTLVDKYAQGALSTNAVMKDIWGDDRKVALLKFLVVICFTSIWCSNVGHPPVFVRKNVAAKGETDDIPISLTNNGVDNNGASLSSASSSTLDPTMEYMERYETARLYIDSLAKPVGSLGTLEDWAARLASLQCTLTPKADTAMCLIFAGDHGVAKDQDDGGENCSAYPQAVTRKVLEALEFHMAGASVLAKQNDVQLRVIDVGLNGDAVIGSGEVVVTSKHKIMGGTKNFCQDFAMTDEEMDKCILAGRQEVKRCVEETGAQIIALGEVGIGNTTTSSALIAALTGEEIESLCGSGATTTRSGVNEEIVKKKISIVKRAIDYHGASTMVNKPEVSLRKLGGTEIAAMVGAILEASERNIAVIVDGFIVTTAAMIAARMSPNACRVMFFASRSTEQGQVIAIKTIQDIASFHGIPMSTQPSLDMNLRMGEGTGALMSVPIMRSAAAIINNMATLDEVLKLEGADTAC